MGCNQCNKKDKGPEYNTVKALAINYAKENNVTVVIRPCGGLDFDIYDPNMITTYKWFEIITPRHEYSI